MRSTGNYWEQVAKKHLLEQNFTLIQAQYNCRLGEIDLIMHDKHTLVFCEVRFRASQHYGSALDSITISKQQRIILAARHFLMKNPEFAESNCRFDVIAIHGTKDEHQIEWVQDAFIS